MTTETVAASEEAGQPDEQTDQRAKFAAGLREFADWLEARPWAPIARSSGYSQRVRLQIDLYEAAGYAETLAIADELGVKVQDHLEDRTSVEVVVGSAEYTVIAWHRNGRPGERDDELARLRAEVDQLRAQVASDASGLAFSRETDDPTPVSPARVPMHTGLVDGGPLATDAVVLRYFSFGHGHTDPTTGESLLDKYVTVFAPTAEGCREAMLASRFGREWAFEYIPGTPQANEWIPQWTEHECIDINASELVDAEPGCE